VIVVDTNVICYRWMASPYSDGVDRAWRKDSDWIAPLLWRSEFRNALAGAIRKRLISIETAIDIVEKAEAQFSGHEFLVSSPAVMRLVDQSRCSAYDCEFVALAIKQQIPLVTLDRDLLRDFAKITMSLEKFIQASGAAR
jgi:predicted nucleic acid-binding protein